MKGKKNLPQATFTDRYHLIGTARNHGSQEISVALGGFKGSPDLFCIQVALIFAQNWIIFFS